MHYYFRSILLVNTYFYLLTVVMVLVHVVLLASIFYLRFQYYFTIIQINNDTAYILQLSCQLYINKI